MESERHRWISRWADHLIAAFHEHSEAILARNAEALELGTSDLPEEILELLRIQVGPTGEIADNAQLLQASYAATFQTIDELLGEDVFGMDKNTAIRKQKCSRFLVLDSVCYFFGEHGHEAAAWQIRTKQYGDPLDKPPFKGTQLAKKGLLILFLKKYGLWDVYASVYWPFSKPSKHDYYVSQAKKWDTKYPNQEVAVKLLVGLRP